MSDQEELHPQPHHHELLDLFEEQSFRERLDRVIRGLKSPKSSGDYKYAKLQLLRLLSPISAVLVPVCFMVLLAVFAKMKPDTRREYVVEIMEPEAVEEMEDIEELLDEPIEPPDPIDMEFTPDVTTPTDTLAPAPPTELSPSPAEFDSVAIVRSPVVMRGIYGSRTPGARGSAMKEFGGSGYTEGAVLRALRWLKNEQQPDGSWNKVKPAMTGLALLTFLAHGETPSSEEFGETVEKAIQWFVQNQQADGTFTGKDGHNYSHPIAAYALCEAYALTKVPMIKEVAEKAISLVIVGQHPSGGWDYNCKQTDRDDTSYMGWCAQAIKAAKMAGLENEGIDNVFKNAVRGFQKNAAPQGGFGYTSPGASGLTGVGVLCMQLLGAAKLPECRKGLVALDDATYNWAPAGKFNANYYWYYITQAKFHEGGDTWTKWNRLFAPVLVKNQTVISDVYKDQTGAFQDMGWWDMSKELSGHTDGPVMNTALAALQLQVYYRYLPTFRKPKEAEDLEGEAAPANDDIEIEITL